MAQRDEEPVVLDPPDRGPDREPGDDQPKGEGLGARLIYIVIIWFMLSVAQTVLTAVTVIQFVIMLVNQGQRNPRLAEFGTGLGIWMAKAVRYQTAASETRPWPWSDID